MLHNIILKISDKLNQRNLLKNFEKIASKLPNLQFSAQFASVFTMGKSENICFLF